jgi:hypothetical protein
MGIILMLHLHRDLEEDEIIGIEMCVPFEPRNGLEIHEFGQTFALSGVYWTVPTGEWVCMAKGLVNPALLELDHVKDAARDMGWRVFDRFCSDIK